MKKRTAPEAKPIIYTLLDDIVLVAILKSIQRTGNIGRAARELDITVSTVRRYLKKGFSDGRQFALRQTARREYVVVWKKKKANPVDPGIL